jgi:transposase-like protein
VHKKRNVLSHLPKSEQTNIGLSISHAYMEFDYDKAKSALELIADNLDYRYPKAAESLCEGLDETLTVHRLKIPGALRQTLETTNPIESANSVARSSVKRVKFWRDGEHIIRTLAAAFMEAEKGFRRIKGYRQIPFLTNALYDLLHANSANSAVKTA